MSFPPRFAVLVDGGFVIKKLSRKLGRFPTADDVESETSRLRGDPALDGLELLRIYFYHARPSTAELTNPISGDTISLGSTSVYSQNESLLDSLELRPDYALRLGEAVPYEWKVGDRATEEMLKAPRAVRAKDLVPNIQQKGVDLRIGLDIARLAVRQMVRVLVVITGDSDLVPAFRFARREGVRVYLDHMGHGVRRSLKADVDRVIKPPE